jgi:hypothetical protein
MLHIPNTRPTSTGQSVTCVNCGQSVVYQNGNPLSAYATVSSGNMSCTAKVVR